MTIDRQTTTHSVATAISGRILVRNTRGTHPAGILAGFHGYAESADTHLERLIGIPGMSDWAIVSIQALNRFYRGRSEEVVAGWMTRQDRELAIASNIAYVDRALDLVHATHVVSPSAPVPIVYAGFSQGGAMAFRAAVRCRHRGHAIVAVGSDVPPELLEDSSGRFPAVLLARGARDDWYTGAKLQHDVAALERLGAAVTPVVFEGGHEWTHDLSARAAEFIRELPR